MNHVAVSYSWNPTHGYSLKNTVDWQLVSWWSHTYNALKRNHPYVSVWYTNAKKEMILEQEAVEGLLSLSGTLQETTQVPKKRVRFESKRLRR
jgi:hypothetical protein